ncbi:MAG: type II secretion system F family protein [Candidatus Thorarchaeota archaeon]|nr:MAG: type II secretion system F family protein [Candidatus Thorarchaeota archaeon]
MENKELAKAVVFLAPSMRISEEGVVAASYLSSFAVLLLSTTSLFLIGLHPLAVVPLSLILAALVYYAVSNYPISLMNRNKLLLSEEADLIYEQFVLVFQAGGTIFDAIEMVAQSDHPLLSNAFQEILARIGDGVPPETCLIEFANNQPSEDLRRYFIAIVSSLERKTDVLEALSGESFEADMVLRQKNLELESRLLVVAALSTYLPIMLTLAVSLGGLAASAYVLFLAPVFVILNLLMASRFSRSFSAYFDRPRDSSVLISSQREIIAEYDEFLNFLLLLGERLSTGDTLEVAIDEIRGSLNPEMERLITPALESVYHRHESVSEAFEIAANLALGQRVANMLRMVVSMCEISAVEAGERISRIASRLVKRSSVAKERESIIAAQKVKVYLLCYTSAAVMGLLASLSPFLHIGAILGPGPFPGFTGSTLLDILPLITTLGIASLSMGYQNTRMVGGARPLIAGFLCLLMFWISLVLSGLMLGIV